MTLLNLLHKHLFDHPHNINPWDMSVYHSNANIIIINLDHGLGINHWYMRFYNTQVSIAHRHTHFDPYMKTIDEMFNDYYLIHSKDNIHKLITILEEFYQAPLPELWEKYDNNKSTHENPEGIELITRYGNSL